MNNANFKTCARGHYYSATLDHCPYCPSENGGGGNYSPAATMGPTDDSNRTIDVSGLGMGRGAGGASANQQFKGTKDLGQGGNGLNGETATVFPSGSGGNDETKTTTIGGNLGGNDGETTIPHGEHTPQDQPISSNGTLFLEDEGVDEQGQQHVSVRNRRKLVGWLVSYTLDDMGMDFKLYEGRNIVGRNKDCQIILVDKTVSGKHAVILFRAGKYSITDQQSSQGTFVNNEDIELEPRYLKDGDMIRMGQTLLKFRSSL